MSAWLAKPEEVRAGQQDDLRGPSNPQDRANVMAFLNSRAAARFRRRRPAGGGEAEDAGASGRERRC